MGTMTNKTTPNSQRFHNAGMGVIDGHGGVAFASVYTLVACRVREIRGGSQHNHHFLLLACRGSHVNSGLQPQKRSSRHRCTYHRAHLRGGWRQEGSGTSKDERASLTTYPTSQGCAKVMSTNIISIISAASVWVVRLPLALRACMHHRKGWRLAGGAMRRGERHKYAHSI